MKQRFALFLISRNQPRRFDLRARMQPVNQEGVEAQTRGPVHEAFAAPQSLDPKPSPIVPQKPPEPVPEAPPEEKPDGSHVVWISGYWAWDDDTAQYMWVSGFWRDLPPGKRWVPGNWSAVAGGWQYSSGFWAAQGQTEISYAPPPPPTLETGPSAAAPAADKFYNPGCWVYVDRQYRWRPGFCLGFLDPAGPSPPACITSGPPPAASSSKDIGTMSWPAAAYYSARSASPSAQPPKCSSGCAAAPRFRVYPEVLAGALFVRAEFHRFCFGDYFGPSYVGHGFIPWVDYRLHKNIPDPLFHQFAWVHRTEANWDRDFRKLYDDRRLGLALRPPRSFAEQERYARELALNKSVRVGEKTFAVTDVKRFTMVNTLAKVDHQAFKLKALTAETRAQAVKTIEHHEAVKVERKAIEKRIVTAGPPLRPTDAHQVGKLPVIPAHLNTPATLVHPAAPVVPVHVERVVPRYEPPRPEHASLHPLKH